MPLSNDITQLDPDLVLVYSEGKAAWKKDHPSGPWPEINEGYRSDEVQAAYYAQSRQPLAEVNRLRKTAGLEPISAAENRSKITDKKPGTSKHNTYPGEALDVRMRLYTIPKPGAKLAPAGITWDNRYYIQFGGYMIAAYRELKAAGKVKRKLRWGHDWNGNGIADEKFYDDPHFEVV